MAEQNHNTNLMPAGIQKTGSPILDEIVEHKLQELVQRQKKVYLSELQKQAQPAEFAFEKKLAQPGQHLIAEIKPSSPSAGVMQATLNLEAVLSAYQKYASAISVLTDEKYFGGSFERLKQVRQQTGLPVLCKDFILSLYQVVEARTCHADAVLLIVKILDEPLLAALYHETLRWGMTPVVEVQNETELALALSVMRLTESDKPQGVLLINNRNLSTMTIDLNTTRLLVESPLIQQLPEAVRQRLLMISASGIENKTDLNQLQPVCRHFLIGSALMKSPDLEKTLQAFCEGSDADA